MDPLTIGLITGGMSLFGNMFSSTTSASQSRENALMNYYANKESQASAQAFNAAQADKAMAFTGGQTKEAMAFSQMEAERARAYNTQMSNTAQQRAVADMKLAGLNPILAAGSGASTPTSPSPSGVAGSGTTASISPQNQAVFGNRTSGWEGLSNLGRSIEHGLQSAIAVKQQEKMNEEIANLKVERAKTHAVADKTLQETLTEENETKRRREEATKAALQVAAERVKQNEAESIEKLPQFVRDVLVVGGYTGEKGGKVADVVSSIVSSAKRAQEMRPEKITRERATQRLPDGESTFEEIWRHRSR